MNQNACTFLTSSLSYFNSITKIIYTHKNILNIKKGAAQAFQALLSLYIETL